MTSVESFFNQLREDDEDESATLREGKDPCYFCESCEDVQTHHIVPDRFNGSESESNKVDLCHDCHWKLERLYNVEFWNAIGIDDPRSSRETHLVCEMLECNEQAAVKYFVHGEVGEVTSASIWVCGDCADDPFGLPQKNAWSLQKDLREVGDDE